jgi:hypothetical protein
METSSDEFAVMSLDVDIVPHIMDNESVGENKNVDHDSGKDPTNHDTSESAATGDTDEMEVQMAAKESSQVAIAKKVAMTVLLLFAGAATFTTYTYSRRDLQGVFKADVSRYMLLHIQ